MFYALITRSWSRPTKSLILSVLAALMLALSPVQAHAGFLGDIWDFLTGQNAPELPKDCKGYAEEAVAAQIVNENNQCGFTGARFSRNKLGHEMWCLSQTQDTVQKETDARNADINHCSRCNNYADHANARARDNALFHCGGTGPTWGTGEYHKDWCMGQPRDLSGASEGMRLRDDTVNQCKKKFTQAQLSRCEVYAKKALEQAAENRANRCGGTGGRWSRDKDHHFAWCTWGWLNDIGGTDIVTAMKFESDARDAENAACRQAHKAPHIHFHKETATSTGAAQTPDKLDVLPSSGPSPFGTPAGRADASKVVDKATPVAQVPGKLLPMPPVLTWPPSAGSGGAIPADPASSGGAYPSNDPAPAGAGSGGTSSTLPGGGGAYPSRDPAGTGTVIEAPVAWRPLPDLFTPQGSGGAYPSKYVPNGGDYPSKRIPGQWPPSGSGSYPSQDPAQGGTGSGGAYPSKPSAPSTPPVGGGAYPSKDPGQSGKSTGGLPPVKSTGSTTGSTAPWKTYPSGDVFKQGTSGLPPVKSTGSVTGTTAPWKTYPSADVFKKAAGGLPPVKSTGADGSPRVAFAAKPLPADLLKPKGPVVRMAKPKASGGAYTMKKAMSSQAIRAPRLSGVRQAASFGRTRMMLAGPRGRTKLR